MSATTCTQMHVSDITTEMIAGAISDFRKSEGFPHTKPELFMPLAEFIRERLAVQNLRQIEPQKP